MHRIRRMRRGWEADLGKNVRPSVVIHEGYTGSWASLLVRYHRSRTEGPVAWEVRLKGQAWGLAHRMYYMKGPCYMLRA